MITVTTYELERFWKYFKSLDRDKSNLVQMTEICRRIAAPRTLFFDSLTELLGNLFHRNFSTYVEEHCHASHRLLWQKSMEKAVALPLGNFWTLS